MAREKARSAKCINNLKQIGLAMFMYAGDNDDFVVMTILLATSNSNRMWPDNLYNGGYMTNKAVFVCPTSKWNGQDWNGGTNNGVGYPIAYARNWGGTVSDVSYGIMPYHYDAYDANFRNTASVVKSGNPMTGMWTRLSRIVLPAQKVWVYDAYDFYGGAGSYWGLKGYVTAASNFDEMWTTSGGGMPGMLQTGTRHSNRINILFCDGHVESVSKSGAGFTREVNFDAYQE